MDKTPTLEDLIDIVSTDNTMNDLVDIVNNCNYRYYNNYPKNTNAKKTTTPQNKPKLLPINQTASIIARVPHIEKSTYNRSNTYYYRQVHYGTYCGSTGKKFANVKLENIYYVCGQIYQIISLYILRRKNDDFSLLEPSLRNLDLKIDITDWINNGIKIEKILNVLNLPYDNNVFDYTKLNDRYFITIKKIIEL